MQDQSTKGNDDRTAFMAGEVNSQNHKLPTIYQTDLVIGERACNKTERGSNAPSIMVNATLFISLSLKLRTRCESATSAFKRLLLRDRFALLTSLRQSD